MQTPGQQGCINAMNKSGQKVAATQGKEDSSCIKDAGLDKLTGMDAEQSHGRPQGQGRWRHRQDDRGASAKCSEVPSFGFTNATSTNEAALTARSRSCTTSSTSPLTTAILTDPDGARCQAGVSKAYEKYAATFVKEYDSCKKGGLKDESITTATGLDACVGTDPKTKISGTATKMQDTITKSCDGVTLATAFPGECIGQAGSAATLSACIANAADCRMCETIRLTDALGVAATRSTTGFSTARAASAATASSTNGEQCDDGVANDDATPDACRTTCVNAPAATACSTTGGVRRRRQVGGDGCDPSCGCEAGNPAATCQDPLCPTGGELVLDAGTTGITCATNGDCVVGSCDTGLGRVRYRHRARHRLVRYRSRLRHQRPGRRIGDIICNGPFVGGPEPCG